MAIMKTRFCSFIDNQFYLSGVNAYWYSFAQILVSAGHDVTTLVLDSNEHEWNHTLHDTWPGQTIRIEYDGSGDNLLKQWGPLLIGLQPDIIIHHYSEAGLNFSKAVRLGNGWQDLYICHSDDDNHYNCLQRHKDMLDHVICVSDVCMDRVSSSHIQNDINRLSTVEYSFGGMNRAVPPLNTFDVLYAGRLEQYQKRARDLIYIGKQLAKNGKIGLHVAGDGSEETYIKRELSDEVAGGHVHFHGFLSETNLFQLMERCHGYLSLSSFEGLSTSLVQAMAHGLAPVVTRTKSGSDFLIHEKNALLFSAGNLDKCVSSICRLATDYDKCYRIMDASFQTFSKLFKENKMRMQIEDFVQKIENVQKI